MFSTWFNCSVSLAFMFRLIFSFFMNWADECVFLKALRTELVLALLQQMLEIKIVSVASAVLLLSFVKPVNNHSSYIYRRLAAGSTIRQSLLCWINDCLLLPAETSLSTGPDWDTAWNKMDQITIKFQFSVAAASEHSHIFMSSPNLRGVTTNEAVPLQYIHSLGVWVHAFLITQVIEHSGRGEVLNILLNTEARGVGSYFNCKWSFSYSSSIYLLSCQAVCRDGFSEWRHCEMHSHVRTENKPEREWAFDKINIWALSLLF